MAQIPYSFGIKPLVKPIIKPAGNPADRNFFSGSAVPVAPKVAPTVNQVRPPLPVAKPTVVAPVVAPVAAPVAAPSQSKFGSPSAVGFNPAYTASNPVNANDRGGDRIQKMPFESMFDPQIQYNLLTKPLAAKYGLEGPASLLNPENYQYKNLQDGVSKFGNTLGNVTNLMAYGTPLGAAFSGGFQAANTAAAQGITAPQTALGAAGGAAAVTFAVKNILSKGTVAGAAGQTVIELAKLASIFGQPQIVNTVKNLTGIDISGYIDTAFNADIMTNPIKLGVPKYETQQNMSGNWTMLPRGNPDSTIFKSTKGVQSDVPKFKPLWPNEALKDRNSKAVVEQLNFNTQRKIVDQALALAREGKLDFAHAKVISEALLGIDMATYSPEYYGNGFPWVSPDKIMKLQSAIDSGMSEAQIAQVYNSIIHNSSPTFIGLEGMRFYDQGLVDAVSERYGPEQMVDLETVLARILQDQQYPLGINMQYNEAINVLQTGKYNNIFGVPNLSTFNNSPIYRPDQIGALQTRRLSHERLVLPGEFPYSYDVEQAKLNSDAHPIYGYHQKPETVNTEEALEMENARAFGPVTFDINDEKKANSFTSTGDSVWKQNFLPYGNFNLEDIVTSIKPNTVPAYTIRREGQNPELWDPRSFPESWSEAQIMGGVNLNDITGATLRYSPGNAQIPAELLRTLDARGIPYQTQEWNSPMGAWWQK